MLGTGRASESSTKGGGTPIVDFPINGIAHSRTPKKKTPLVPAHESCPHAQPPAIDSPSLVREPTLERTNAIRSSPRRRISPSSSRARPRQSRSPPVHRSRSPPLRPAETVIYSPLRVMQSYAPLRRDYQPFLSDLPIDPRDSYSLHELQLKFFTSTTSLHLWSRKPRSRVFEPPTFSSLNETLLRTNLDFSAIQSSHPLEPSRRTRLDRSEENATVWLGLGTALDWIYGTRVSRSEIVSFVEHSPLPLLLLARLHGDRIRYASAVRETRHDFETYLSKLRLSNMTKREGRARELVEWLNRQKRGQEKDERWNLWWSVEVQQARDDQKSLTTRWLDEERGWEVAEDLDYWEQKTLEKNRAI